MKNRIQKNELRGNNWISYGLHAYNNFTDNKGKRKFQIFHNYYTNEQERDKDYLIIKEMVFSFKKIEGIESPRTSRIF